MRLMKRGKTRIKWREKEIPACIRPLSGELKNHRYGEYAQDMLRILLPFDAVIIPGERVEVENIPYICVYVRRLQGHVQADLRRCLR